MIRQSTKHFVLDLRRRYARDPDNNVAVSLHIATHHLLYLDIRSRRIGMQLLGEVLDDRV